MLNVNTSMSRVNQDKLLLENTLRTIRSSLSSLKTPIIRKRRSRRRMKSWLRRSGRSPSLRTILRSFGTLQGNLAGRAKRGDPAGDGEKAEEGWLKEEAERSRTRRRAARAASPVFLRDSGTWMPPSEDPGAD